MRAGSLTCRLLPLTMTVPLGKSARPWGETSVGEPAIWWGLGRGGAWDLGLLALRRGEPRTSRGGRLSQPLPTRMEQGAGAPGSRARAMFPEGLLWCRMGLACTTKALGWKWAWALFWDFTTLRAQHEGSHKELTQGSGSESSFPRLPPKTYSRHPPCARPELTCSLRVRGVTLGRKEIVRITGYQTRKCPGDQTGLAPHFSAEKMKAPKGQATGRVTGLASPKVTPAVLTSPLWASPSAEQNRQEQKTKPEIVTAGRRRRGSRTGQGKRVPEGPGRPNPASYRGGN